jgi:GH24 family phage-related lysozyme (muramidase)
MINEKGIALIKSYEKLFLRAYDDFQPNVVLTDTTPIKGTLSIGYGSTGKWIKWNTLIDENKANELLAEDIAVAENRIKQMKLIKRELTTNQYAACVSFVFNCGGGYIDKSSGKWTPFELWNWINENRSDIKNKWIITAITSKGKRMNVLINIRLAEVNLYLS